MTFCDTKYGHRFINFEIEADFSHQFEKVLAEYINAVKVGSGNPDVIEDKIVLTRLQEVDLNSRYAFETLGRQSNYNTG